MAQRAENLYCGVNCGILDRMASAAGRTGEALLLDCRTGTGRPVSVPAAFRFRVVHCGEARRHAVGACNERRRAVEEAALLLGLSALRDAVPENVEHLPAAVRARARHAVTENMRVLAAVAALEAAWWGQVSAANPEAWLVAG
ncbi:MAG: hypothetical protein H5U13_07040 [Parvibaculum sp.]|nr:hypothetical protein [Parvibaculum sp.]